MALVVAACGGGSDGTATPETPAPDAPSESPAAPTTTTAPAAPAVPLECELKGYPCTPADVPDEIHERADALGDEVLAMLNDGSSTEDADAWLRSQPDVAEVESQGPSLWFRVEGGRGVWVLKAEALANVRGFGGSGGAATEAVDPAPYEPMLPGPPMRVVGGSGEQKRALILSPMLHEFGNDDEGADVAQMLSETRGYEGGVTYLANPEKGDAFVNVDSFKGWNSFDVIHIITHGTTICFGGCRTAIAAGIFAGPTPDEPGVYDPEDFRRMKEQGVEFAKVQPSSTRGLELLSYVVLTADFFRHQYPTGLDNAFIFFNTCHTVTDDSTDVADAIRGSTSVFLGWDASVHSPDAQRAGLELYEHLAGKGYTAEVGYDKLKGLRTDSFGTRLRMIQRSAGGDLRIRNIVRLLDGSEIMKPSSQIAIDGKIDDDEDDRVPWRVKVDGIIDDNASQARLHVEIDGEEAEVETMDDWDANDDDERFVEGFVDLERDLEDEETVVDFRAWIELPSTGESEHRTEATLIGLDVCVIGTWSINPSDVVALHTVTLGDVAEEVFAEGSVTATFRGDGTVTYTFGGWKIGNTTFTESALPGILADLTGEVSFSSNGTATGTWTVEGENLTLIVADFDTTVIQRIYSFELEIDESTETLPDMARLYVIPNGTTRHLCNDSQLGVEWENGGGVRWFRTSS